MHMSISMSEHNFAQEFGVTGYPTLKVFQGKSVTDYRGPKSAEGIAT